jgi:hypothetical protein
MDPIKLIQFGTDYLSEYFWAFILTLIKPTLRFQPILQTPEDEKSIVLPHGVKRIELGTRLNPKLISFVIISIIIGSTINGLIPRLKPVPDFQSTLIYTLIFWVLASGLLAKFCNELIRECY